MKTHHGYRLIGGLALAAFSGFASAFELDMHGALAQGYVLSEGNNILGSSKDGSRDLYEVALNGRAVVYPRLLVAGQLMARRAGNLDEGKLRVDYAQLDYQILSRLNNDLGVRVGKLKNPYGFFNDTRDVVFARPSVTLPASVYFDGLGFRDLFFSAEGAQLYGHYVNDIAASEWTVGMVRSFDATDAFASALDTGLDGEVDISDFYLGQWLAEWAQGRVRTGLSHLGAKLDFMPTNPAAAAAVFSLDVDLWVLSAQYQGGRSLLTSEYRYLDLGSESNQGRSRTRSDGIYLQYRFLQSPALEWYLRYDLTFSDRNDRNGREYAAQTGRDRHRRFGRDATAGVSWKPWPNWGVFAEHHYVDGTASVDRSSNSGALDRYWQVTYLMLAYRF